MRYWKDSWCERITVEDSSWWIHHNSLHVVSKLKALHIITRFFHWSTSPWPICLSSWCFPSVRHCENGVWKCFISLYCILPMLNEIVLVASSQQCDLAKFCIVVLFTLEYILIIFINASSPRSIIAQIYTWKNNILNNISGYRCADASPWVGKTTPHTFVHHRRKFLIMKHF